MRPTMDKVRAAIFSSLGDAVPGAVVLDLFAGSGALGLEALSRGAARAVFVESNPRCIAALRGNAARCRLSAEVVRADAIEWLRGVAGQRGAEFDLVFADPPYVKAEGQADWAMALWLEPALQKLLKSQGLWVLETAAVWQAPEGGGWRVLKRKVYGETAVYYLAPA